MAEHLAVMQQGNGAGFGGGIQGQARSGPEQTRYMLE